ncbi:unnamed protein product [Callosobruchus maculatus]|uniref:Uncharacterized protein n=1 Tax=Callosobruchus maculatus TaxID=64391 RepID=A0A653DWG0_CALMS|nr:unnamed protein product [Callosobruchus maculatus]
MSLRRLVLAHHQLQHRMSHLPATHSLPQNSTKIKAKR